MRLHARAGFIAALFALCAVAGPVRAQFDDALPYGDEEDAAGPRRFHAGLTFVGVNHLGGVGLGLMGMYTAQHGRFGWGGELLMMNSGEHRVPPAEAHNRYYLDENGDPPTGIAYVYEQATMVGIGGTVLASFLKPPRELGFHRPGVGVALAGGFMIETDRVGLRPNEVDQYYGYGSSDTALSLRPYIRPQLIVSQGPVSVIGGMAFLPVFASWSIGVAYGW